MVKIKDFTLASQNLGGDTCPPCPTHRAPMHDWNMERIQVRGTIHGNMLNVNLCFWLYCLKIDFG